MMPQIERRHPWFMAFDIVLIAPAPGVKLITTDAVNNENQTANVTPSVYGARNAGPRGLGTRRRPEPCGSGLLQEGE